MSFWFRSRDRVYAVEGLWGLLAGAIAGLALIAALLIWAMDRFFPQAP